VNLIEHIDNNITYKDASGTWRHIKCSTVVSRSLKTCKFCSNIKDVLNRERRRVKITKCDKELHYQILVQKIKRNYYY